MDIRYPIGRGELEGEMTPQRRKSWIKDIEDAPKLLRAAVENLSEAQLDTPYRDGGWTVRQIVHHLCDSNINSYIRFKLAATEDEPTVKVWEQSEWAELIDARTAPVELSLALLDSLHVRWVMFLRSLSDVDMKRTFIHPESGVVTIEENIGGYSWHCRHHTAQITGLRVRMCWS
ncbi:MAG: putative metal-dependent hydrolase [Candidatus Bathyarchaeota archaeon]|nr:putative metal-dependent hydrolase [Candidatus Bathyarchaeota archaeon]